MTVSSQTNNATFVGNGVTTDFPLPFRFFSNSDVFAYFIDPTTGASTPMVLGTDYTLAGAGEPEVNGNAVSVLTTTAPLANGRGLYVERIMQEVQSTDIVNQGEFFASTHEDVFDRMTMLIQQANANSNGAIRVAIGDPEPQRLAPAARRANLILGFDALGQPITVAPVSGSATDLAINLANNTDPAKGAALVGFLQAGAGAVGRTMLDKAREVVSVKDFGAVGDGVTDDTAAIQAAIDAVYAGSLQGGSLYFPKGNYLVTSSIHQRPRVNFVGDGSRKSQIIWGAADLTNYQKGVVYCVAGTDAAPDFVFSTCIEGMSISGGSSGVPVALAIRGHQENCRFVDLLLGGFTAAGLEALPFSSINHGITFSDLHIIPRAGATAAFGMRLSHTQKCVFDNITTDISNPNYYEAGIYLYNAPILNVFRAIHTEDCKYGFYVVGGANNIFIGLEARNNVGNGVAHFYATSTRHSIYAIRTIAGFANHYKDASRTIAAFTDTDSVLIELGGSYYRRVSDTEEYAGTLSGTRLTRGVDASAGTSGAGQTYLRTNSSVSASSTRYIVVDLGAGSRGFAGKLSLFSTGDERHAVEVFFSGYAGSDGSVATAEVSAQTGTGTTRQTIGAPQALAAPTVGKIRIPITNGSATFTLVFEVKVEITIGGRQASGISTE